MNILWRQCFEPTRIQGDSISWTDDEMPLSYVVTYCTEAQEWNVYFEGALVCCGSLEQCLVACEKADETGIFEDHPDLSEEMTALQRIEQLEKECLVWATRAGELKRKNRLLTEEHMKQYNKD